MDIEARIQRDLNTIHTLANSPGNRAPRGGSMISYATARRFTHLRPEAQRAFVEQAIRKEIQITNNTDPRYVITYYSSLLDRDVVCRRNRHQ